MKSYSKLKICGFTLLKKASKRSERGFKLTKALKRTESAFTLIELLVVMAILGILATVAIASFTSSQMKARDAQRKSDLKAVAGAVELFYNDYGFYTWSGESFGYGGIILGCPYTVSGSGNCDWGGDRIFTDEKTIYLKYIPKDPGGLSYYYRTVDVGGIRQGFQIYAHLENSQDTKSCIGGNCTSPPTLPSGVTCGAEVCNFAITSPNVTPTTQ